MEDGESSGEEEEKWREGRAIADKQKGTHAERRRWALAYIMTQCAVTCPAALWSPLGPGPGRRTGPLKKKHGRQRASAGLSEQNTAKFNNTDPPSLHSDGHQSSHHPQKYASRKRDRCATKHHACIALFCELVCIRPSRLLSSASASTSLSVPGRPLPGPLSPSRYRALSRLPTALLTVSVSMRP